MSDPKDSGNLRGGGGDVAAQKVLNVIADLKAQGFSKQPPFQIGKIEHRMEDYANAHGITVPDELYMCPHGNHSIAHALRDEKVTDGVAVDPMDLAQFAKNRLSMDLYYDRTGGNFIYVDGRNKFVVHPNEPVRLGRHNKVNKVNFITASKLGPKESFKGSRYDKIK